MGNVQIITGDCRQVLRTLPAASVHCCVTSPPYFGLRDYGVAGQIGLERTLDEFITEMVMVFREVRRVLRDDGTLWLNLGDSYAGSWGAQSKRITAALDGSIRGSSIENMPKRGQHAEAYRGSGLKAKDLMMVPARVALALQADGWWLRKDIIWHKPAPMPESVTDRPSSAHEHVFLMSKSSSYFYDAEAVRVPVESGPSDIKKMKQSLARIGGKHKNLVDPLSMASGATNIGRKKSVGDGEMRHLRDVWTIASQPFGEAHFATFPPDLVEPCIKAGTGEQGCCPACGACWRRIMGPAVPTGGRGFGNGFKRDERLSHCDASGARGDDTKWVPKRRETIGWEATCSCSAGPTVPCTVLDPFGGAGTVGLVADRLGRNATLIELNPAYSKMALDRIHGDAPLFSEVSHG